jgi:hypothetical protein
MILWQLPVDQDKHFDKQIHHNAKYHCFVDRNSLCGKYWQTEFFESFDGVITDIPQDVCKVCYRKWKKQFNIGI